MSPTSITNSSSEIEKVRADLGALRGQLRQIFPDGHMTVIDRLLYRNLLREIKWCTKRLKELEQDASSLPGTDLENLETDQASANHSIQTYQHFTKDILEKIVLVDDLCLLLNNFRDESVKTLEALRSLYRTLDTFDRRFLLIRNPMVDHLQVLRHVVQETSVTYLAQCNDTKMLHYLLRLYEGADSVQFANSMEVVDAFLVEGNKGTEAILRQDWSRYDFLNRPVFKALQRVPPEQLSAERLLSLVSVQDALTKEQYEWIIRLLFGLPLEELVPLEEQLRDFMNRMCLKSYYVSMIDDPGAWEGCIALSQKSPLFAQWFIYNELVNLPESAQEKLLSNLQSITDVLRVYQPSDELKRQITSPVLLEMIRKDWQGGNFTPFVKAQPSGEPLGKRLHEIVRRRSAASLSNGGTDI